jgi:hypothetical protein
MISKVPESMSLTLNSFCNVILAQAGIHIHRDFLFHPREGGDPVGARPEMDSRLRGNDDD